MADNKELGSVRIEATIKKYLIVQSCGRCDQLEPINPSLVSQVVTPKSMGRQYLVTHCDQIETFKPLRSDSFNRVDFEAVKNEAGSEGFRFQLAEEDEKILRSQFATSSGDGSRYLPYAFTRMEASGLTVMERLKEVGYGG